MIIKSAQLFFFCFLRHMDAETEQKFLDRIRRKRDPSPNLRRNERRTQRRSRSQSRNRNSRTRSRSPNTYRENYPKPSYNEVRKPANGGDYDYRDENY